MQVHDDGLTVAGQRFGGNRVIGIMAAILTAFTCRTADDLFGTPQGSPRTETLISASVQWAERIMERLTRDFLARNKKSPHCCVWRGESILSRCAAAILARAAAESLRLPPPLELPVTPLNAAMALSNFARSAFNCSSTAPRSVIVSLSTGKI